MRKTMIDVSPNRTVLEISLDYALQCNEALLEEMLKTRSSENISSLSATDFVGIINILYNQQDALNEAIKENNREGNNKRDVV